MKHLWSLILSVVLVGCLPKQITSEDELEQARIEKAKHPEQWTKPKKLTSAEAREQEKKWLAKDNDHNEKIIAIESEYRCS